MGGYGRAELSPGSDIDLYLLYKSGMDVAKLAETLWYPIWDQGVKLGHAVRTVKETLSLAADDLDTATAVLSARHIVGDASLSEELATKGLALWRKRSKRWLEQLDVGVKDRHAAAGEVAFLLEPDLKDGRGGLRDVHAIRWAEAAEVPLLPGDDADIAAAYELVLSVRVELHRRTGRHERPPPARGAGQRRRRARLRRRRRPHAGPVDRGPHHRLGQRRPVGPGRELARGPVPAPALEGP